MNSTRVTPFAAIVLLFCCTARLTADVPVRSRVVDVIILRDGDRLLGTVKQPVGDESVSLLMRTDWLRQSYPELLDTLNATGRDQPDVNLQAIEELNLHLQSEVAGGEKNLERTGFLREQIERLQFQKKADPDLVLLKIPAEQIRRRFLQLADRRSVAFAAILNNVAGTETMTEPQLRRQLKTLSSESLLTKLPALMPTSISIADRILIDADRLFGRVTRLIRHGGHYLSETDDSNSATGIASQFLLDGWRQQLQQFLSDPVIGAGQLKPLPPTSVLNVAAAKIANDESADLVELTSMQVSPVKGIATVMLEVYRQRDDGDWHQVLLASAKATSKDITAQQQAHIENDPQVKQVLRLFESLGATTELSQAVAVGAIVQVAQQRAQQELMRQLSADRPSPMLLECALPADAN